MKQAIKEILATNPYNGFYLVGIYRTLDAALDELVKAGEITKYDSIKGNVFKLVKPTENEI